ncbi:MAG: hypothetical protein WB615_07375, partial [Candidatus Tumulicola sp.]
MNILVPQTGHLPSVAGRPFFMVIWTASWISRLVLHLTQYASAATAGTSLCCGHAIPVGRADSPWTSPQCPNGSSCGGARPSEGPIVNDPVFAGAQRLQEARGGRPFEARA